MPRSENPLRSELFPDIVPYASGMLQVDSRHTLYWEQSGNPEGVPVVFLHGGPGAGSAPVHRRFFDPAFYRIVIFDQRGSGRFAAAGRRHRQHHAAPGRRSREIAAASRHRPVAAVRRLVARPWRWPTPRAMPSAASASSCAASSWAATTSAVVPARHAEHLPRGVARVRRAPAARRARRRAGRLLPPADRSRPGAPSRRGARMEPLRATCSTLYPGAAARWRPMAAASRSPWRASRHTISSTASSSPTAGRGATSTASGTCPAPSCRAATTRSARR